MEESPIPTLVELISKAQKGLDGCEDVAVNLSQASFASDEVSTRLTFDGKTYLLKVSESDPNNPRTLHAHKQLCKACKVPYAFYKTNRGPSRETVINGWLHSMDPLSDKSTYVLKVRNGREATVVRAILPLASQVSDIEEVLQVLKSLGAGAVLLVIGEERDSPEYHLRVAIGETFDMEGREYQAGLAITMSDVDSVDVECDLVLMDVESKSYLYCSFGGNPYFSAKASQFQFKDFLGIITGAIKEAEDLPSYASTCLNGEFPGAERALSFAVQAGKIPKTLYSPIYREINGSDDIDSMVDFTRHVSLVARDQSLKKRIALERAAGSLAGFMLSKRED